MLKMESSSPTKDAPNVSLVQGVGFTLKRLSDYTPGESWILLVYGPSKSGKTEFAGTAGNRTLYINTGDGLETLLSPGFRSRNPDCGSPIIVDLRPEIARGTDSFDLIGDAIEHGLKHHKDDFDTIVLDEATAMRRMALNKAIDLVNVDRKSFRVSRTKTFVRAEVGDYGIEMDIIKWFLGNFIPLCKSHKKHFLMLAHERQVFGKPAKMGDEAPLQRILPGFTGKTFPDDVPAYFDDVWHMETKAKMETGKRVPIHQIRTAGDDRIIGGSRHSGIFQDVERNPNFKEMLRRIQESHKK
jgi:hypothetical protein